MTSLLSLQDQLARVIYLNQINPQFYCGNPTKYQKDMSEMRIAAFQETIENDLKELFTIIDMANRDNNLPRRSIIFLILGHLMNNNDCKPEIKNKITAKTLECVKSDEDLFDFIKYYTEMREKNKMPSSIEKMVRRFYNSKSPEDLAKSVANSRGINKWSHKDLIKLSHYKADTPLKNAVINYMLSGKISETASEEELNVLKCLIKSEELRKTNDALISVSILDTYKFSIHHVSSSLLKNEEIWTVALENMTIQEILPYLRILYKYEFLKPGSTISNQLINIFTNEKKVENNNIHPIEVFSALKRFEKGGKPMDVKYLHYLQEEKKMCPIGVKKLQAKAEVKCEHISKALLKCFELACINVTPTNKRFLVSIDITEDAKKALCIGNKVLSLIEAAVAYCFVLLRVEKNVVITTYREDKIDVLSVGNKVSYSDLFKSITSQKSAYSLLYSAIDWAANEKKPFDVFVNFIHNNYSSKIPKEKHVTSKVRCEPIINYRQQMNLSDARVITFAPVNRMMPLWKDTPAKLLDVFGFDAVACKAAECFAQGQFS